MFRGGRGRPGGRGWCGGGGRGGGRGGGGGVLSRRRKTFSPEKTRLCAVCKDADHKYRCPRCSIQYCSLKCFQCHKSKCLDDDEEENPDQNPDRLKRKDLRGLNSSQKLKQLLANPYLRNLVLKVDEAEDKNTLMQAAMQEPLFLELADACLEIVDKGQR